MASGGRTARSLNSSSTEAQPGVGKQDILQGSWFRSWQRES